MPVSRARVQQQAVIIKALGSRAASTVAARIRETGEVDAVVDMVVEMAGAYSEMSAALTARYYNEIRAASRYAGGPKRLPRYSATSRHGFNPGKARAAALSIVEEVQAGTNTVPLDKLLGDLVMREIKNAADECIRQNVRSDPAKPKYAIVPNGDACAFCQMRASLGYTYGDDDAVESHDHCSCVATPVFGKEDIQGYDPKEYESRWNEAARALKDGDISDDLQQRIEAQKAEKGKDFDRTNAVLMVMREQQGIK